MTFCHLHVHGQHSMLDGLSSEKALAQRARDLGQPAIALTDHGNMHGAIEFYEACKGAGVKPIIGCELYVTRDRTILAEDEYGQRYYHLIALAKDMTGYRNLLALVSESFKAGFYYKGRVDRELLERHSEGLIILSACLGSELAQHILNDRIDEARKTIRWYQHIFGGDYFIELQSHGQPDDEIYLTNVIPLADEMGVPMVATGDSHYTLEEDAEAAQVMHCVQSYSTLAEPKFGLSPYGQYYLKSTEEMEALFGHVSGAIENSLIIADRCTLELDLEGRLEFPDTSHVTGGDSPLEWLTSTCYHELERRHNDLPDEYMARFQYELSIIEQTGFAEYLILVYDFVRWARDRGIPAVPRGSAAGSLLLYLLGVSDIDPIEYGLTFERFLNPERVQMPDVDMDFADERRAEVFDYLVSRYGRDHVAQIATFGQLKARNSIKDTARVLDWESAAAQKISDLIPKLPVNITLTECLEKVGDLKKLRDSDPKVARLLDLALKVEGTAKSVGVHASGVVVCKDPLSIHTPLQPVKKDSPTIITQYSQKSLEHLGLLKMDVLGLANLTMLERCVKLIEEHRGITIDVRTLADKDEQTFAMLCRGETSTVFQLEGGGMTRYVKELQPEHIRHLAVMVALYRPGPMALLPHFIARRHGREPVEYLHSDLEPILGETYGVLVYQDQVLQILEKIAGYTKGQADIVRRAMGKKEADLMASEKAKFLAGARSRGYDESIVDQLWEEIEPHAGYSFNKAHATCYGFVAYQTAWLKAHYPVEWTAAVLQTSALKPDELPPLIAEARDRAIPLLVPDVNQSFVRFSVEALPPGPHGGRGLRYGLGAIKGVGEPGAEILVREREENGPYISMKDLLSRVDTSKITSKTLELLAKAGALEDLGPRESILATLPAITKALASYKGKITRRIKAEKVVDVEFPEITLVETFTPPPSQYLDWELEALGLFLSDHPFARAVGRIEVETPIAEVEALVGKSAEIVGAVIMVKEITTKKKKERMALVTLGDLGGTIEAVVFPSQYRQTSELWHVGSIVRASGKVEIREDKIQLVVDDSEAVGLDEAAVPQESRIPERMDDTTIVNVKDGQPYDVYIGRANASYGLPASPFANPCVIGKDGTRDEVIAQYRAWLPTQAHLMAALPSLRSKRLGCWCAPAPCHGDVIVELLHQELVAQQVRVRLRDLNDPVAEIRRGLKLHELVRPGQTPLVVVAEDQYGNRSTGATMTVALSDDVVEKLTWLLGKENVHVVV